MEITYAGDASFRLKDTCTVAINPAEKAEAGTVTLYTERKAATKNLIAGPGEYEIAGALIATVPLGAPDSPHLAHAVNMDGTNVLHIGSRIQILDENAVTAIGRIDVLIVNADDLAIAQQTVSDLMPRVVVPFGSQAEALCAALGVKEPQPALRFTWSGTGMPPKAVLLKAPGRRKRAA